MSEGKIQTQNPANRPMHYGDYTTGRLNPPDYIPKYRLYSYTEGERRYNEIQHDLYVEAKKAKPSDKRKGLPLVVKILCGLSLVGALIFAGYKKFFGASVGHLRASESR